MTETHAAKPAYAGPAKGAELDLCFLLDATGSMGSYIASATRSIHNIVEKIKQAEHADVRFALVAYRDHPPQESTFVTQTYAFTGDVDEMTTYLSKISATGGGDGPEAVTAAMRVARDMPWRPNATKVAVIIADAPPHGLGESGDGFPNGDPDGHDPLQIARAMRQHGISIFVVACEPSVSSSYKFAIDFFRSIADITGGSLLPLTSAELLPPAIIGGAQEQMQLERLVADAEREADELRKRGVDKEEDIAKAIHSKWASSVRTTHVKTDDMYQLLDVDAKNLAALKSAPSLQSAMASMTVASQSRLRDSAPGHPAHAPVPMMAMAPKTMMRSAAAPEPHAMRSAPMMRRMAAPSEAATFMDLDMALAAPAPQAQQQISVETDSISLEQVQRLMSKSHKSAS